MNRPLFMCLFWTKFQVFSGPEVSMDRDSIHHGGMEHREVGDSAEKWCLDAEFFISTRHDKNDLRESALPKYLWMQTIITAGAQYLRSAVHQCDLRGATSENGRSGQTIPTFKVKIVRKTNNHLLVVQIILPFFGFYPWCAYLHAFPGLTMETV